MLFRAIPLPARIDELYRKSGKDLPPLALSWRPDVIWKEALENLTSRRALRKLCELIASEPMYNTKDIQDAILQAGKEERAIEAVRLLLVEALPGEGQYLRLGQSRWRGGSSRRAR